MQNYNRCKLLTFFKKIDEHNLLILDIGVLFQRNVKLTTLSQQIRGN